MTRSTKTSLVSLDSDDWTDNDDDGGVTEKRKKVVDSLNAFRTFCFTICSQSCSSKILKLHFMNLEFSVAVIPYDLKKVKRLDYLSDSTFI